MTSHHRGVGRETRRARVVAPRGRAHRGRAPAAGLDDAAGELGLTSRGANTRRPLRSAAALLAGFVAIVVLSVGTDQLFHALDVHPPWGEPMNDASDNLLALAYRCAYGALGSFIAARLAPAAPMALALGLGAIGLPLSALGMVAAIRMELRIGQTSGVLGGSSFR